MNELSLVIKNPDEGEFLEKIEWNKEAFMEAVTSIVAKYEGITYTDDQMAMAKEDRANLNKMKTAISDRRIQIKKEIMKPYELFEEEVKEVVAPIENAIQMIDSQVKGYEEQQKADKKAKIEAFYEKNVGDLDETVEFERLFEQRWLNKSVSLKKATNELKERIDRIREEMELIRHNCRGDMLVAVMNAYLKNFDMNEASQEMMRLQRVSEMEEQRLRDEAMQKEKRIQNEADEEENPAPEEKPESQKDEKIYRAAFVAYGTKNQLIGLKKYMADNGIRVEKE